MRKVLLSGLPKYVQCSLNKNEAYQLNVVKYKAIDKYNFIQVRHDDFYKFIIIDVDNRNELKTYSDILNKLKENNITFPYCIVKTTKGWHIWWVLEQPVFRSNRKQMFFFKKIKQKLNKILGGDNNFSHFIARNPLLHETYYVNKSFTTFNDFLTKDEFIYDKRTFFKNDKRRKIVYTNIDLTKVKVGERHNKLLKYLRTYAFIYFKDLSVEKFIEVGLNKNRLIPIPLTDNEVIDMCKSIYKWVEKEYKEDYNKTYVIKRNRLLAKQKKNKTKEKMFLNLLESLYQNKISLLMFLRQKYSWYFLSKLLKVDRKTIKKYFSLLKRYIINILKQNKQNTLKIININVLFKTFIKYIDKNIKLEYKKLILNERWAQLYET